ncbi:hypothetical protein Ade02nite_78330 [Paractinoplanes deccanensis]|uniref:Uncharacterized protein n=1 Tax=Paractinoplanes deccanensis TaxID=113561 RepID=A0ABQ3YGS9_9ACTN|nr:hypothetical protein Ade02nite_78330 [Actinoplanes deccanensis]
MTDRCGRPAVEGSFAGGTVARAAGGSFRPFSGWSALLYAGSAEVRAFPERFSRGAGDRSPLDGGKGDRAPAGAGPAADRAGVDARAGGPVGDRAGERAEGRAEEPGDEDTLADPDGDGCLGEDGGGGAGAGVGGVVGDGVGADPGAEPGAGDADRRTFSQ